MAPSIKLDYSFENVESLHLLIVSSFFRSHQSPRLCQTTAHFHHTDALFFKIIISRKKVLQRQPPRRISIAAVRTSRPSCLCACLQSQHVPLVLCFVLLLLWVCMYLRKLRLYSSICVFVRVSAGVPEWDISYDKWVPGGQTEPAAAAVCLIISARGE